MRTIDWVDGAIEIVDQTALPDNAAVLRLSTVDELIDAVRRLAVRGAPALGVAGALGVALAAYREAERGHGGDAPTPGVDRLAAQVERIATARPTAVNLALGARRAATMVGEGPDAVLAEALRVRDEEVAAAAAMAARGADLVTELCGPRPRLLTHCNTGALASVEGGTALAVIFELHRRGELGGVIASETRPLLQGARLTAWELSEAGIGFRIAVDSAGPFLMARGEIDAVILGADRVCGNGDVVNKIGSYAHALGAGAVGIPFLCVAPESTIDLTTPSGADVEIEDRGAAEVVSFAGRRVTPERATAVNPAFDVTPSGYVTAVITERRVIRLDQGERP